jgi:RsiW-degrading membrane proteinase PrsW (M82 family)
MVSMGFATLENIDYVFEHGGDDRYRSNVPYVFLPMLHLVY